MTLMILAGVWALAYGQFGVNGTFKMKGNEARILGLALILVAAFGLPHAYQYLNVHMPKPIAGNDALRMAWEQMIGALGIYLTAYVMSHAPKKIRLPMVSIRMGRSRA